MELFMDLISTVGFPIACVVFTGWFIYQIVTRDKDEAKERENKLIEANMRSSDALEKVADSITNSDIVNKELSETNRLLVEKVEDKLTELDGDVKHIINKLDT